MPRYSDLETPEEEFDEAFDRFENSYPNKFRTFNQLLDAFAMWGGKKVIPSNRQELWIKHQAIEREKIESNVMVREWFKNGKFYRRYVDISSGKFRSKKDYEQQFERET